jgi:nucleoside-diphosphate-sugar epimerase
MRVLVTGATGFVGQHTVAKLLDRSDIEVIATGSRQDPAQPSWLNKLTYVPFDITVDSSGIDLYAFFGKPDAVIHLAWPDLSNFKALAHIDTHWLHHYRFLTNLLNNGLTDLTTTGTCLEYGLQSGCLSEELPTMPTTAYGMAKDILRRALTLFLSARNSRNVSFKWLRLFYMFGTGQNPKSLLAQLETAALRGDTVFNMSKGEQLRDYLPVTEVADIIMQVALQQQITGAINCCSGQPVSVRTFVEQFMQDHNYCMTLNLGYYPYPDYEPLAFWGNNKKLLTVLNNDNESSY